MDTGDDRILIKICVGNRDKQVERNQMVYIGRHRRALLTQSGGHRRHPFGHIDQQILHSGHICRLAANTRLRAALAACGFLTLITKHFRFHKKSSLSGAQQAAQWLTFV